MTDTFLTSGIPSSLSSGITPSSQEFTSQTSINVVHSKGFEPIVIVLDSAGVRIYPLNEVHNSINDFTITFTQATTGKIIWR